MNALAYTIAEACTITRTGKTALYQAIKTGELRAVKRGRRTLLLPNDLEKWIAKFPTIERLHHKEAWRGLTDETPSARGRARAQRGKSDE
jgi:excisionase family DNA binding protein